LIKFSGKRKYLFIIALLILITFCYYFIYAFGAFEDTLLREKAWEKQQDVNLLCEIVDKLAELDTVKGESYGYEEILRTAVLYIEANYTRTFAQAFDEDLNALTPLSPGVGGGQKHNPLDYPEFVEAVKSNEYGNLSYWYETEQAGGRYIHMYFRWVPTDASYTSRHLIAVGVSKYTIKESIDSKVTYGAVALMVVTAIIILSAAVLLSQMEYLFERRKSKRERR